MTTQKAFYIKENPSSEIEKVLNSAKSIYQAAIISKNEHLKQEILIYAHKDIFAANFIEELKAKFQEKLKLADKDLYAANFEDESKQEIICIKSNSARPDIKIIYTEKSLNEVKEQMQAAENSSAQNRFAEAALNAVGPLDGRYQRTGIKLSPYFSEKALMTYRLRVEIEYLKFLSESSNFPEFKLSAEEIKILNSIATLSNEDALEIKEIEKTTNHDVKSVELFLKEQIKDTSLADRLEWIHIFLTSEDVDNIALALMMQEASEEIMLPSLGQIKSILANFAQQYAELPMLARTHGQAASPTTFGKEFKVFEHRVSRQIEFLKQKKISAKFNGATGNYNAHEVTYPGLDWQKFSSDFISQVSKGKVDINHYSTQVEGHDTYQELFSIYQNVNNILEDFVCDIWRYISDGWIGQKLKKGEVGSSTMAHKINPINFENAEGNIDIANARFYSLGRKMQKSRLQRDLSLSTVRRTIGTAFAHSLLAYESILKGLDKIEINDKNKERILYDLEANVGVLAEAIQTVGRKYGVEKPYEILKEATQGIAELKQEDLSKVLEDDRFASKIPQDVIERLKNLKPSTYTGIAEKLAK